MDSLIKLVGVSRQYDTAAGTVVALPETDLTIDEGEFVAIEGPSGSGKSTLLNIIGLLDQVTAGSYRLEGQDTTNMSNRQKAAFRANKFGFVFQSFHILPTKNVIDNVAAGLVYTNASRRSRYKLAYRALEDLGLAHRMMAHPSTLSGGERQRVAIARAIIGNKRLLLADEPTGNLDRTSSDRLLESLNRLHALGMAIVIVTHDGGVAQAAQRRIRIGT